MKATDILLTGLIGFGVYLLLSTTLVRMPSGGVRPRRPDEASVIARYDGWTYYSDGTVIAPNGDYYYQGQLVWSNSTKAIV